MIVYISYIYFLMYLESIFSQIEGKSFSRQKKGSYLFVENYKQNLITLQNKLQNKKKTRKVVRK